MEIFNTHKFLFTLNYNGEAKGHRVFFLNSSNEEIEIVLDRIEIGTSHVSCKLFDKDGNRHLVPFVRVRKVMLGDELVWDNTDANLDDVKVIKGYK